MNDGIRAKCLALLAAMGLLLSCSDAAAWLASAGGGLDEAVRIGDDGNPVFGCRRKVAGEFGFPIWTITGYDHLPHGPIALDPAGNCIAAVTLGTTTFLMKVNGATGVEEWTISDPKGPVRSVETDSAGNILTSWEDPQKRSSAGALVWRYSVGSGRLPDSRQVLVDGEDDVVVLRGGGGNVGKVRGSDGVVLWTSDVGGGVLLALTPTGDAVMAGMPEPSGTFTILELSGVDGRELWRHEFVVPDVLASPLQYGFPGTGWTWKQGALVVDAAGNVAAVGRLLAPEGGTDAFAVKLSADGDEVWRSVVASGFTLNDDAYDAAFDAAGNLFVAGGIAGQAAAWKLSGSSGSMLWSTPLPFSSAAVNVVVDRFGNPVVSVEGAGIKLRGTTGADYLRACGNGILEPGETCDDANLVPGDGCSAVCQLEVSSASGVFVVTTGNTATPAEPAQVEVTSPSGGAIEITRRAGMSLQPGFSMLGIVFDIQAPAETSENPLIMTFLLEASLVPPGGLVVFKDGVAVDACTGSQAAPDPCIADRTVQGDGDVLITVLASTASDWTFGVTPDVVCGNGVVEIGEQCDDGNGSDTDCCTASCQRAFVPSSCAQALGAKASLKLKKDPLGRKSLLKWKWKSAAAFDVAELGTPATTTPLAFCVYDADGLVLGAQAPAGGTCAGRPCWQVDVLKGKATYADKALTPDGIGKLQGKSGVAGKGRLAVQGKGPRLSMPASQLTLPVRAVLLRRDATPDCWEATFSVPANVRKNDGKQFLGKSD